MNARPLLTSQTPSSRTTSGRMPGIGAGTGPTGLMIGTIVVVTTVATLLSGSRTARAHVNDNLKPGSDILMKDLRWPIWDAGTYYCTWYAGFTPKGAVKNNFYGGLRTRGPRGPTGMFWTFWGDIKGVSAGRQFGGGSGYGAEGSAGGFNGRPDFLRPNSWYRFVIRVYPPKKKDKVGKAAYVGWWIKDVAKEVWYHHSTAQLLGPATGLSGNGGFVEAMAGGKVRRIIERRLGYGRQPGGEWYKADGINTNEGKRVKVIENGTIARYDTDFQDGKAPADGWFRTPNQPDKPTLDPVIVENASATGYRNQVSVHWSVPDTSSPQMGHRIEVFATRNARGEPVLVGEENANYIYGRRFDTPAPARSVRLTVIDIFDQEKSVVLPVKTIKAADRATRARKPIPGLLYELYEAPGNTSWTKLSDLPQAGAARRGRVSRPDHSVRQTRRKNYGMKFSGYLKAPADGLYMLMAGSSDGSRLRIDGKQIMVNDGVHGSTPDMYPVSLGKGLHRYELEHFVGQKGATKLLMRWEGPGFERRDFTSDDFMCDDTGGVPEFDIEVKSPVVDGELADNLAVIHAVTGMRGHKATQVQLFADRKIIGNTTQLGPDGRAEFRMLLPRGKRKYWARLWYDERNSVNSKSTLELDVKNYIEEGCPWTFSLLNNDLFPIAARYVDGKATFTGQGFYFAHQKVSGDFTITGHISDITLATRENGLDYSSWVGLMTSRYSKKPPSPYGTSNYMIFRMSGRGMRTKPDTRDLGGGHISSREVAPPDHRWLRIVRRGLRHCAYTSADGKEWEKVNEQISNSLGGDRSVGICYRAIPGKGRRFFQATMDNVTIEKGAFPEQARHKPTAREVSLKNRITAVVQSSSDKRILYARSPTRGILASPDRGDRWRASNGRLRSREAMAVRSVAVHYENPKIVLRGGGAAVGGRLKSGLWKSTDGARTWKLVSDKIDFDGSGPTSLFGEVITFSRTKPNLVAAGGESSGVYVSRDAGDTWQYAKLKGERITALFFCRDPRGANETLLAGTFADSEFETLGLGRPNVRGKNTGAVFEITASGKGIGCHTKLNAPEFGVTGVTFGTQFNFYNIATTRGVYHRWPHGNEFLQKRHYMPTDTLNVAFGHRRFITTRRNGSKQLNKVGFTAPFSSPGANHIYRVTPRLPPPWKAINKEGSRLVGAPAGACVSSGLTCIHPDDDDAKILFLCNVNGIYKSTDEGRTFKLVCVSQVR